MNERIPAEVFPTGDFIKEELEARGWTQNDLADILGKSGRFISDIINGKNGITPTTAIGLSEAFETSPEYWMNLESTYQLRKATKPKREVSHRARLYKKAPIKEMIKRGWIEDSTNLDVLERNTRSFFEIETLEEEPQLLAHAARKSTTYEAVTPAQMAWLFRVKHLAKRIQAEKFSSRKFDNTLQNLNLLWSTPEESRHVPRVLAEGGIRFLVVEALPQTKIDGACFWLDSNSPVIVLSLRYDRIDYFWHTIMHELGHVKNRDGISIDRDIFEQPTATGNRPPQEVAADRFAVENLVPQDELEDFIVRMRPIYPKTRLIGFASLAKVHPGIVLGQLQHRGEIQYGKNRDLLLKVRDTVTAATLTDGFGNALPAYP